MCFHEGALLGHSSIMQQGRPVRAAWPWAQESFWLWLRAQMADFGLSRVLESDATHVSTFTYGEAPAWHRCMSALQHQLANATPAARHCCSGF
jgi:hypothetical protein